MRSSLLLPLCCSAALLFHCASPAPRDHKGDPAGGGASSGAPLTPGDNGGGIDPGGSPNDIDPEAPRNTTLRGITYAPNGTLPLAGVLVYTTNTPPEPIPDGAYCDSCRVLPEGSFVQSTQDGSFELKAAAGQRYLVVEKGQFRRVRRLSVEPDGNMQELAASLTTLPRENAQRANEESDSIPKIAVLVQNTTGDTDQIHLALTALGITHWENFGGDMGKVTEENLKRFHIVLFPCQVQKFPNASHQEAIRKYVAAGGKVYASDWSHGFVDQPFKALFRSPNTHWTADDTGGGALSPRGHYDDPDLKQWLGAVSPGEDPNDTRFEGVWSTFGGVREGQVPSVDQSAQVNETPRVFASIADGESKFHSREAAVSLKYGCGRALLSVFHVHGGSSNNLLMQEKALLHMLLDVSTCIGEPGQGPVVH